MHGTKGSRERGGKRLVRALILTLAMLPLVACGAEQTPTQVGRMAHPELTESSGIVASRQYPDVFWTHNDGSRPNLYAIKRDGKVVGEFRAGAAFEDWEDIAWGPTNQLYLADTGNNKRKRREVAIYRIAEPDPLAGAKDVTVSGKWVLRYPGEPFDSEGLFIWNDTGYLVSKVTDDQKAEIFRFSLTNTMSPQMLQSVTRVDIDSPVTGADISSNGRLLAMIAKWGTFVFRIDGDVAKAGTIKPLRAKFRHDSAEGCCFVPGGLVTCAESREVFFFSEDVFGLDFD